VEPVPTPALEGLEVQYEAEADHTMHPHLGDSTASEAGPAQAVEAAAGAFLAGLLESLPRSDFLASLTESLPSGVAANASLAASWHALEDGGAAAAKLLVGNGTESLPGVVIATAQWLDAERLKALGQVMAALALEEHSSGGDLLTHSGRDDPDMEDTEVAESSLAERLGLMAHGVSAYRDEDGWRMPIDAQLYRRNEGRHRVLLNLCRKLLLQRLFGIDNLDSDADALRLYEERARLVFRSLEMDAEHRGRLLEARVVGPGGSTEWRELPPTDRSGRVETSLRFTDAELAGLARPGGQATIELRLADQEGHASLLRAAAVVQLVEDEGLSVISDIDDTVKVTEVFDGPAQVLRNTFLKDFTAVSGMAELLSRWSQDHGASVQYVSKSPPELYEPLHDFLQREGFPVAAVHLCPIWSRERSSFKERRIESILRVFPRRRFVLVGDSGEQDPAVYAGLLRRHPEQISKILIREVTPQHPVDLQLFRGLDRRRWQVFRKPSEATLPPLEKRSAAPWLPVPKLLLPDWPPLPKFPLPVPELSWAGQPSFSG